MSTMSRLLVPLSVVAWLSVGIPALAQEGSDNPPPPVSAPTADDPEAPAVAPVDEPANEPVGKSVTGTLGETAKTIDENKTARETSAGILKFIDDFADHMSFATFHWAAFALLATGIVSFTLQLVLGKLIVLASGGFSLTAILSDALGLLVSVVGLVLTTQAAADNSTFTRSPAAVLSATAVGVIAGFLFYLWGQRQELDAARGRNLKK